MYVTRFTAALAAAVAFTEASVLHHQKRAWTVGQAVKTTSGTLIGTGATNKTDVSQYVGIPFAYPPVGDLRWAAPKKFTSSKTINATTYSSDCAANTQSIELATGITNVVDPGALLLLTALMQLGNPTAEDCLSLNVWTKPQTGAAKKPVMVWIYGGGFATGNTNNPVYDGEFLANNEDVVVVTLNYRVNVFGFPGVPGVEGMEQNPGLLDQRMAVEWVRDNIANFGGDPEKITIFGESAGGASVDFYNYAWTKDPIIAGSIAESGSVASFADPQPKDNVKYWDEAAVKLNCPTVAAGAAKSVACMRAKDTAQILNATFVPNQLQAVLGHFGPNVDNKVVFGDYKKRAAEGNFIKKPYMAGSNENEAGLFVLISGAAGLVLKNTDKLWPTFNTAVFNCPASWATTARQAAGVLTYRYRYFGDYLNSRLLENPSSGAWHTAEIPMIFGTVESTTVEPNTKIEQETSNFMQSMWAAFARNPKSLQAAPFNLPTFNPNKDSIIALGANNVTHQIISPVEVDGLCVAVDSIKESIPGGIAAAIMSAAAGGDLGIPGLAGDQLPDLTIPYPAPPSAATA